MQITIANRSGFWGLCLSVALFALSGCGSGGDGAATSIAAIGRSCATDKSCPVAEAGNDRTVPVRHSVTLDGSQSVSNTADLLTYEWTLTAQPNGSTAILTGATTIRPSITPDLAGVYTAKLVVRAGGVTSVPNTVNITAGVGNLAPIASGGSDRTVRVGTVVTLDGSGSTDPDGITIAYSWHLTAKPAGSAATLNNPTSITPSFTADRSGTYKFSLTVSDGTVTSGVAHVAITATTGNVVPVANAGSDQIAGVGAVFTLDGTGSAGDTITAYNWRFQSVPVGSHATLANGSTVTPTFIPDRVGFYVLTLSVNDGHANSPLDTVVITGTEAIGGSGTVQPTGGTITTDLGEVTIPPNTALKAVRVTVTPVAPRAGLPVGLTPLGVATDITVTPPDVLNTPLLIKLKYSDSNVGNENAMAVAHYNIHLNKYEPVTVLAHDTVANTIHNRISGFF